MQIDIYQKVTDQIIAMLEQGVVPWRSPILGRQSAGLPKNLESGKDYRGINSFLLAFTAWAHGYESYYWLTFNQAKQKKGSVKKGEKSSLVIFWKQYEVTDEETGEPKNVPVLRYYNVFNVTQCEGIAVPDAATFTPIDFKPIDAADAIVKAYADAPVIEHGGTRAFYRPSTDVVRLPEPTRFASCEEYYSTKFHELGHSTGHSKRLDRKLDTDPQPFGSPDYSKEELVAEMAAAFLSAYAGIQPVTIENQAAYVGGWLKQIRQDKKLVITAAGAAQKASDYIRGERKETEESLATVADSAAD